MNTRIAEVRKNMGMSQKELAKKLGVAASTLNGYEKGKHKPTPEMFGKIAMVTGCSVDFLIGISDRIDGHYKEEAIKLPNAHNIYFVPTMNKMPMLNHTICHYPILTPQNISAYIDLPTQIRADFALVCKGDGMIGVGIHDGDVVYIRKQEDVENGQIAAVVINSEATLRRFYRIGDVITLNAENPSFEPLVFTKKDINDLNIIGRAVGFTRAL